MNNLLSPTRKVTAWLVLTVLSGFAVGLYACQSSLNDDKPQLSRLEAAAGTATALIEDAKATLIVRQAQVLATSMIFNSKGPAAAPPELVYTPLAQVNSAQTDLSFTPTPKPTPSGVQIVDVSTAANGQYLIVEFTAPVRVAETWQQGNVYVMDEFTGNKYNEVPVTGSIGPLFARPKEDGKLGYVMLVNLPIPLKAGALVTVVLGDYRQEHLTIK